MRFQRKKTLFTIFYLLLAIIAIRYWKVSLLIVSLCAGISVYGLVNPTPMPPHRKGHTPDEEWDDYEHQRYDRINARRRRERTIAAQETKAKSSRFERIKKRRHSFYD